MFIHPSHRVYISHLTAYYLHTHMHTRTYVWTTHVQQLCKPSDNINCKQGRLSPWAIGQVPLPFPLLPLSPSRGTLPLNPARHLGKMGSPASIDFGAFLAWKNAVGNKPERPNYVLTCQRHRKGLPHFPLQGFPPSPADYGGLGSIISSLSGVWGRARRPRDFVHLDAGKCRILGLGLGLGLAL